MNAQPESEREVPPRIDDTPFIRGYLLRRPFIHFGITFSFYYAVASLVHLCAAHLHLWQSLSDEWYFVFALLMAIFLYASQRRRFSSHAPRS
jgi:hypothetical protein